jgi:hypothetical protein
MEVQTFNQSPEIILQRIDAIIHELQALRQVVARAQVDSPGDDLAQQLYGVLGQGDWSEYDKDLDWQRFDA